MLLNTNLSMNKIAEKIECSPSMIHNINRGKIKKYWNENIHYPIRNKQFKPVSTNLI